MAKEFLFYDLETSGLNPRQDRIMQFAAQRTDQDLQPIGEPISELIALSDDVLPSPDALMVTKITPQQTLADGYNEQQFASKLINDYFTPNTIVVGFNNIRFDDEFIRYFLWRNFYDPYEWSWKENRSRWDILDLVRMTRALRPEGINWPVDEKGNPTNRLELITKLNGIDHFQAHDALSDVTATIAVARLIKSHQPQLFDYLFKMRRKSEIAKLVNLEDKKPFVYTSGRYDNQYQKTTVAFPLTAGRNGNVVVYDLRYNPEDFINLSSQALEDKLLADYKTRSQEDFVKLPIKELQYNRAPAVAPLGVLAQNNGWQKINLKPASIEKNIKTLLAAPHFAENIRSVFERKPDFEKSPNPEAQLYDGFLNDRDRNQLSVVRSASQKDLLSFTPNFVDERLPKLLLHYKARNFKSTLSESEVIEWENWRSTHLKSQIPTFLDSLRRLSQSKLSQEQQFVLEELQLWLENVIPA